MKAAVIHMNEFILTSIYLLTIGILFCCIFYLLEHRNRKRETYIYVMALVCVELWCISQILIFVSNSQNQRFIAYLIGNLGICFIGTSWIEFSILFSGKAGKHKIIWIPVFYSVIMYGIICTNSIHNLYYSNFQNGKIEYGFLFYINIMYDYLCVMIGNYILLRNLPKQKKTKLIKSALICSVTIPLFLNVIYQFRHDNLQYDLTPIGFSAGCLLVLLITFKWNAFDVKTDVYGKMVKNMRDGILIFDSENKLIFYNKSIESVLLRITGKQIHQNSSVDFLDFLTEQQREELENQLETLYFFRDLGKYHIQKQFYYDKIEKKAAVAYIFRDISKYYELEQKNKEVLIYKHKLDIEQERNRMIQIIHDGIGHNLTVIRSLLFLSRKEIEEITAGTSLNTSEIIEYLNQAAGIAGDGLKEIRENICNQNRGEMYCLVTQKLTSLTENIKGIDIEVMIQGNDDEKYMYLSDVLYENLREAVTNTLKYGNADKMDVIVRFGDMELDMFIFDNGDGCSDIHYGNGLKGMRERTSDAGGTIQFISAEQEGFRIIIKLPLIIITIFVFLKIV